MELAPRFFKNRLPAMLALSLVTVSSYAAKEGPAIVAGPFSLEPALGSELRYDDNIFRSAASVESSWIMILAPRLLARFEPRKHRFDLAYRGEYGWYFDSSPDNYVDHRFGAGAYLDLTARSNLDFIGSYDDAHENRGTGQTEGFLPALNIPPDPDRFQLAKFRGRFSYGSRRAKGRLVFEAGYRDLEFTNHQQRTRFANRDGIYGDTTFFYRVRPKVSLLLDAKVTEFNYQYDRPLQSSLDSTELLFRLGATWDTTAKTTGIVKMGYVQKDFDSGDRIDASDVSWEVDISWSPRTYSHLEFQTARYPDETTGGGSFVVNTQASVMWRHEWADRIQSRVSARYLDQEFLDSFNNRQQQTDEYSFVLNYQMRRWLNWEVGVDINSRDSNIGRFVFDENIYRMGAFFTL
jgi:hypothetical protein